MTEPRTLDEAEDETIFASTESFPLGPGFVVVAHNEEGESSFSDPRKRMPKSALSSKSGDEIPKGSSSSRPIPKGSSSHRRTMRNSNSNRSLFSDEEDIEKVASLRGARKSMKKSNSARDIIDDEDDTLKGGGTGKRMMRKSSSLRDFAVDDDNTDGDKKTSNFRRPIRKSNSSRDLGDDDGSGDGEKPKPGSPRRSIRKTNSSRDLDGENKDPLKNSSHRRRTLRKTNSSSEIDSPAADRSGRKMTRSSSSRDTSVRSRSRSKHKSSKLEDYSKSLEEGGVPLSIADLFSDDKDELKDRSKLDTMGRSGGLDLSVHSERKPKNLDISVHSESRVKGRRPSAEGFGVLGLSGDSGPVFERNSSRQRLLDEAAADAGGDLPVDQITKHPPSTMRRSESYGTMKIAFVASGTNDLADPGRIERLEVQKNLYKEQFKVIVKEKKELVGMYNAKIEAKDELMKHLQEEIEAVKAENGKLKANLLKSGTGSTASSVSKKPEKRTGCYLSKDSNVLITTQPRPHPSVLYLPGLRSMPLWTQFNQELFRTEVAYQDPSLTWAVQHFETHWGEIADEYQRVAPFLPSDLSPERAKLGPKQEGKWSWHSHILDGKRSDNFLQHFPQTCDLINDVREKGLLVEKIPFAHTYLSTLSKNSRLCNHTSPINFRVRLFLPLMVPGEHCDMSCLSGDSMSTTASTPVGIRVGPTTRGWQTGRTVLVDDSYDHELWNNESERFVYLIVDLWHPDVTIAERKELVELFHDTQASDWMNQSSSDDTSVTTEPIQQ